MNDEIVIELGAVSEETRGSDQAGFEGILDPVHQPKQ